ncbi:MAG TPA: cytochrome d ubiquinol oxidase subunit II [Syntrophorhabdales bacterium]|nr:cytochrome d ubiquinol oxidase subunit II [Syntrophorhabdales bacterium]
MLETIWFLLWGILWALYFMLDGFDLGLGTLMPFLGKNDTERRIIYNTMGPFWDGNEVWLITAGGVTFAAFPGTYAVLFSAFYSPLMIILFALIIRAAAFEFRGKLPGRAWRSLWDGCLALGSFVPALLFGVAFANIFRGIPIDGEGVYQGSLFTLLNLYSLLGGLLFLLLFLVHGALWLAVKSEGILQQRAIRYAKSLWLLLVIVAVLFLAHTWFETDLYHNYRLIPALFLIPLCAVLALLLVRAYLSQKTCVKAWFASCLVIICVTLFGVMGLYPNMLISSMNPAYNLTAFNAASSPGTLKIMLVVALIFVPIVILYQGWVYLLFRHKVHTEDLQSDEAY